MSEENKNQDYGASNITVLEGLEGSSERPAMYIEILVRKDYII